MSEPSSLLWEEIKRQSHYKQRPENIELAKQSLLVAPAYTNIYLQTESKLIRKRLLLPINEAGVNDEYAIRVISPALKLNSDSERLLLRDVRPQLAAVKKARLNSGSQQRLATLKIRVEHDGKVFEDQVKWVVNDTSFIPEQYVQQVCADLRLQAAWLPLLQGEVFRQLHAAQDLAAKGQLPQEAPQPGFPRLNDL